MDGKNVTPVYGPYTATSGVNFGAPLGMLSAGTHNYSIVATDKAGNPTSPAYTGSFTVVASTNNGPTIGGVAVVEATGPQDGTLTTGESLVLTFNALDPDGVAGATLQVDGKNVTPVYGPYTAASGVNFGVALGMQSAGTHNYSIVATDKAGNATSPAYTGSFTVVASTNNGPTVGGVTVVQATGPQNGTLTTSESILMTWNTVDPDGLASATLQMDGKNITPVYGPYATATGANFSALLGILSAGTHNYSIVATDKAGNPTSPAYTGSFNVVTATNPGPTISGVTIVTASGLMTWNALDSDGVASSSLQIDGADVSNIYGPYVAASGVNFSGVFGTLLSGSHTYTITATDNLGNQSQSTGTFNVPAGSKSLAGSRSLASSAVLGALATKNSTSVKVEWLDDEDSALIGSTPQALDAALASY